MRITRIDHSILRAETRLDRLYSWRLALGTLIAVLLVIQVLWNDNRLLIAIFLFAGCFIYLVSVSRKFINYLDRLKNLKAFYLRQWVRFRGDLSQITNVKKLDANSQLSRDLNIFGPESLTCLLDETFTRRGFEKLFKPGLEFTFSQSDLEKSAQLIPQLSKKSGPLRRFVLEGQALTVRLKHRTDEILNLMHTSFIDSKAQPFYIAQTLLFFAFSVAALAGYQNIAASLWSLYALLTFGLLLSQGSSFSRITNLLLPLEQLSLIFSYLDKTDLKLKQNPSRLLKKMSRVANFLSTEAHPVIYIGLNLLLPWTPWWSRLAEKYRLELEKYLPQWLDQMTSAERWASLTFFYRYQTQTFPEWGDEIQFSQIRHPLLPRATAVPNTFRFGDFKLALITGSNMSGKSTFLRTVGLNHILAMMGAPVTAKHFMTRCIPLETCISVSDSLADGLSYFYAEVKQLKKLLDRVQNRPGLYLIDEVFRGTNNKERFIGAHTLLQKLAKTQSWGIVSTHDLELSQLEEKDESVQNFHFREEFRNHEMHFTYQLHAGPSPTTNALEIMRREGLF